MTLGSKVHKILYFFWVNIAHWLGTICNDNKLFSQSGTDDFRTLSAIYSQLGNAYFYLGDYVKAMQV